MADLRDSLWIWGLTPGQYNGNWAMDESGNNFIPINSRMTPAEAALYLGARNVHMVVNFDKPEPPFDQYTMALTTFNKVIWSVVGDVSSKRTDVPFGDLEEVLRQAEMFPNVVGGVLDDFFCHPTRAQVYTPDKIKYIKDTLHNFHKRPLELWCVYYPTNYNSPEHLQYVDGCHMWTWKYSELQPLFWERYKKFKEGTEGKRRMLGLYLANFGEGGIPSVEDTKFQLETYTELLVKGEIEGIIFCSNAHADLGWPNVEFARKWIEDNHKI